jgi:hypothetical protein
MDITEPLAARAGLTSGVSVALVGRWALGLLHGQWAHVDIARSTALPGEVRAGWAFHFLIGEGAVALLYAVWLQAVGWTLPAHRVWGGVAFGAATWLLLLPPSAGAGSGGVGREGPTPSWPARYRTSHTVSESAPSWRWAPVCSNTARGASAGRTVRSHVNSFE